jgi:hypothetical protein
MAVRTRAVVRTTTTTWETEINAFATVFIDIAKQQGRIEHHECTVRMIGISHLHGVCLIRCITQVGNMSYRIILTATDESQCGK